MGRWGCGRGGVGFVVNYEGVVRQIANLLPCLEVTSTGPGRETEPGWDSTGGWFLWRRHDRVREKAFYQTSKQQRERKGKERKAYGYDTRGVLLCLFFSFLFFFLLSFFTLLNRAGRAFVRDRQRGQRLDNRGPGHVFLFHDWPDVFWDWGLPGGRGRISLNPCGLGTARG